MTDLEAGLLPKDDQSPFGITCDTLKEFMSLDGIKDYKSVETLIKIKGIDGLASRLKVNLNTGLSNDDTSDLMQRITYFGNNSPIVKPPQTICDLITEQFEDKILRILCAAALVSLIVGILTEGIELGWIEGFAIFVAVFIIVSVTAINNYLKEKQFRKLYAQVEERKVNVKRNGKVESLSIHDLLVGDIVIIETGEIFPVDGILTHGNSLSVDESSMTGESDLIHKLLPTPDNEKTNPFLISGSKVIEGTGEMMVIAVGKNSFLGIQKMMLQEEKEETPLQQKLAVIADDIGKLGMFASGAIFVAMMIHMIVEAIYYERALIDEHTLKFIVEAFILAVTIIVVAVPEGLPLAVTISLAYSVEKMRLENNLVRYLEACETMGGANNICSDKTGTLTMNLMTVTNVFTEEMVHSSIEKKNFRPETLEILCEGICLNTNAFPKVIGGKFEHNGNKTECALLEYAYKMGYNFEDYRPSNKILKIIPFSSRRKRMTIVYQLKDEIVRVHSKGAPDILLEKCTEYINENGVRAKMTPDFKERIYSKVIRPFAKQSLRTLLLAYKDLERKTKDVDYNNVTEDFLEDELIFLGIMGIKDPLRKEIPEAIKKCKAASITVRMVTGDNIETATAISKDAGIIPKDFEHTKGSYIVMEGKDFREQVGGLIQATGDEPSRVRDISAFGIIAKELKVLARSSPEDKYLLVTGLKQLGNVVAVTGDGTNDAPALKKADIGFAMGIAGTEVAKEAAGIILVDDNFSSIVTAVKWGRNIFDSIRKFLQFQITVNIVAIFMAFLGGVVLRESPLNPIQMLWVNLIMDTFAALALATEEPTDELLKRPPYPRDEYMITPVMWRNIIMQAIFQSIVLSIILFKGDELFNIPSGRMTPEWTYENGVHYTIFFDVFVFMQVFNEINARKLKREEINVFQGFWTNPLFLLIFFGTIFVQILLVQMGGYAVKCSPLTWDIHLISLGIGFGSIIVGVITKFIPEEAFGTIKLFKVQQQEVDSLMKNETFIEKIRKPSRGLSIMRQKSIMGGSRGSFKKIL